MTQAPVTQQYRKVQKTRRVHEAYQLRKEAHKLFHVLASTCQCSDKHAHQVTLKVKRYTDNLEECEDIVFDLHFKRPRQASSSIGTRVWRKPAAKPKSVKSKVKFVTDATSYPLQAVNDWKALEDLCKAVHVAHQGNLSLEIFIDEQEKVWGEAIKSTGIERAPDFLTLESFLATFNKFSSKIWLHREKAILAVLLAYSLLQLHSSPWLMEEWTSKSIFFLDSGSGFSTGRPLASAQFKLRHPYVTRPLDTSSATAGHERLVKSRARNHHLLALGMALLELYLNRSILDEHPFEDIRNVGCEILEENADSVNMSQSYYEAVRFCLLPGPDPVSRSYSFEEAGFRELYYKEVIVHLENDLNERFEVSDKIWDE